MTEAVITSVQNPAVKAAAKLHDAKDRKEQGLILIEGRHPVDEAIAAGLNLQTIFVREEASLLINVPCVQMVVADSVMAKIATTDTPPPILAVAEAPKPQRLSPKGKLLALVDLQDPGNLGTLIRSACAFGVTGVALVGHHMDPYQPKVIRASAGLVFRLAIAAMPAIEDLAAFVAASQKMTIWAADANKGTSYREIMFDSDVMLILGAEAHGLPEAVWKFAKPVHIPMAPDAESLNVAVAGSILLSQMHQRN